MVHGCWHSYLTFTVCIRDAQPALRFHVADRSRRLVPPCCRHNVGVYPQPIGVRHPKVILSERYLRDES